jgi:hypothetical protein
LRARNGGRSKIVDPDEHKSRRQQIRATTKL